MRQEILELMAEGYGAVAAENAEIMKEFRYVDAESWECCEPHSAAEANADNSDTSQDLP